MESGNIPSQIVVENLVIARCTRRVDTGKVVSVKFKNPVSKSRVTKHSHDLY